MNKLFVHVVVCSVFLLSCIRVDFCHAQVKNVTASYTFTAYKDTPVSSAEQIAVQRARQQALADAFGSNIQVLNSTYKSAKDDDFSFGMLSSDSVKGEWLKDTKAPVVSLPVFREDGMYSITATVWGRAREISASQIPIEVITMCDGIDQANHSDRFRHGSNMYIQFRTPVSGYLIMYLLCEDKNAYRLLPYRDATEGSLRVERKECYVFFHNEGDESTVDECIMQVDGEMEVDYLYVIFSPNQLYGGMESPVKQRSDNLLTPAYMGIDDFQKWTFSIRTRDDKAVVKVVPIMITRK